eukprot:Opistho-2@63100
MAIQCSRRVKRVLSSVIVLVLCAVFGHSMLDAFFPRVDSLGDGGHPPHGAHPMPYASVKPQALEVLEGHVEDTALVSAREQPAVGSGDESVEPEPAVFVDWDRPEPPRGAQPEESLPVPVRTDGTLLPAGKPVDVGGVVVAQNPAPPAASSLEAGAEAGAADASKTPETGADNAAPNQSFGLPRTLSASTIVAAMSIGRVIAPISPLDEMADECISSGRCARWVVTFGHTPSLHNLVTRGNNHAETVPASMGFRVLQDGRRLNGTSSADGLHEDVEESPEVTRTAIVSLWGKGSLKLRKSTRRTFLVTLDSPIVIDERVGAVGGGHADAGERIVRRFMLLSLWEDTNRLKYRTSASLLAVVGIWPMHTAFVEVRIPGVPSADGAPGDSQGVYLLVEFPLDAVARVEGVGVDEIEMASRAVLDPGSAMRNRSLTGKEEPDLPLRHFPSFRLGSALWGCYAHAAGDARAFERSVDGSYVTWLAVNSLLMNGDYADEAFFYAVRRRSNAGEDDEMMESFGPCGTRMLRLLPWDYDSILRFACHNKGVDEVKDPLLFCAEAAFDRLIAHDAVLRGRLREALWGLVAGVFSVPNVRAALAETHAELAVLAREGVPLINTTANAYKAVELIRRYEKRYDVIALALDKKTQG